MDNRNAAQIDFEDHVATPIPHETFFYSLSFGWAILMAIILFATAVTGSEVSISSAVSLPAWQVALGIILVWSALSLKKIEPDELGAVLFWGKTMIPVRRGPKFIVAGIFQLERFKASVRQNQFPDEPEFVQKTDDETPLQMVEIDLPDGTKMSRSKVRPIRITTGKPEEGKEGDILNVQMVVEFTFWVRWIVVNPFLYIVNTDGSDDASRAAGVVKQMRDTGESALSKEVTTMTPSVLISNFAGLQSKLQQAVIEKVAPWGVKVVDLGMTAPDINHQVASALRDIPKEKAIAVQVRTKADAEAYRLEKEGEGLGKKRAAELTGEGRGYKAMADILGITGGEALAAQVARDTVGEGDLIVGMEGITQVLAMGKAVLANSKKPEKKESE